MSAVIFGTPRLQFDVLTSTNDVAKAWVLWGAEPGTLLTSGSQTSGRGRRGQSWADDAGQSALMTFIAGPLPSVDGVWRIPFAAALAVFRALHSLGAQDARTKWPNDVVAGGRKIAGVLVETVSQSAGSVPLIGIGVNVGQREFADAASYAWPPTSLTLACGGRMISPEIVIERVSTELSDTMGLLGSWNGWTALMDEFRAHMLTGVRQSGRTCDGRLAEGVLRDVSSTDGAGLIDVAEGEQIAIWPDVIVRELDNANG